MALAAFLAPAHPSPAQAQTDHHVTQQISETAAAAALIEGGKLEDAKRVLVHVLQLTPNDNQAIFLVGMIAVAEKRYDAAIEAFRRILAAEPDRERVRLELARAFFLEADYDNAERNFKFARAGDLPPETKTLIDQYLGAIIRLRQWSYSAGIALAGDTNANGATTIHTVDLYGLPFTLSDNARQKSGAGIAIDLAGEWSPLVFGATKARIGAFLHGLEYGDSAFDDTIVSLYAGPEFLLPRWQIDIQATSFEQWFGNHPYNNGVGGRTILTYYLDPTLQISISVDVQSVSYNIESFQNGPLISANIGLSYTVSPASILRLTAGIASQRAKLAAYANNMPWLALDYYRDLPLGFSGDIQPAYSWTHYDAALAAFGKVRSDGLFALRIGVLNRRIEYAGFAPSLSYIFLWQQSSIALYRYSRNEIQFGITRQF